MNNAQLQALRIAAHSMLDANGADYPVSITKTTDGYEVRRQGKLVGVTTTREGALELVSATA